MIAPDLRPDDNRLSFEDVYRRHERDIVRYLTLLLGSPHDAEDVAADTFGRAFEAWREGRGPAGRPLPWLLTIARRLAMNRWRRRRLINWLPLPAGRRDVAAQAAADDREFWHWLDALARTLPLRQREVLILRYRRDLDDAEIGEVMGLSVSGVRSLRARAIQSLRNHPELLR